jgi:AcrR family transcriptional regulator
MIKMSINITSQEQKSAQTRQIILDSAIELFKKYGVNKVTIDDICNNCELTKGSFYYYFPSKDYIVTMSVNSGLDKYIAENYFFDVNTPFKEQLISLNLCAFNYFIKIGKEITRASYVSQVNSSIDVRVKGRSYVDNLTSIIENALIKNDFLTSMNFNETYIHCIAVFTGILMKWCTYNDKPDDGIDWTKMIKEQFRIMFKD